jgi:YVTN family beta-propeller protein
MKLCGRLLVCLLLALSAGSAQRLEGWIALPDSLHPLTSVKCLIADTSGRVYAGGPGCDRVLVVRSADWEPIATPRVASRGVELLCFNPVYNKVYCADQYSSDTVTVVDCRTLGVVARVPVGSQPVDICCNTMNGRVYCLSWGDSTVSVIDGESNSRIAEVPVCTNPQDLCYHEPTNTLFCCGSRPGNTLVLIACSTNTTRRITVPWNYLSALYAPPSDDRVYCACDNAHMVVVLSASTGAFLDTIPCSGYALSFVDGSANGKVYCGLWETDLAVINCATVDVETVIPNAGDPRDARCYDPIHNKVFCCGDNGFVRVVDGSSNQTEQFRVGHYVGALQAEGRSGKVLAGTLDRPARLLAIDPITNLIADSVITAGSESTTAMCWTWPHNKLYVASRHRPAGVFVIDGATGSVLRKLPVSGIPVSLCYNTADDKLYCSDSSGQAVLVFDGATDSLLTTIPVGTNAGRLMYAAWSSGSDTISCVLCAREPCYVTVIDGPSDSIVGSVNVGSVPHFLCYDSALCKAYCLNKGGTTASAVDVRTLAKTASVSLPGGPPVEVAIDARRHHLFCLNQQTIVSVDCSSDTVMREIDPGDSPSGLCISEAYGEAYTQIDYNVGRSQWLTCIVAVSATGVNSRVPIHGPENALYSSELCYDARSNTIYCCFGDQVSALKYSVVTEVGTGLWGDRLSLNTHDNRLYVASRSDSRIAVLLDSGPSGIADAPAPATHSRDGRASVIRNAGLLSTTAGGAATIVDATGRVQRTSANGDVGRLPPGVYFLVPKSGARPYRLVVVH